jgi:acyl-CoA thioester hydrolase
MILEGFKHTTELRVRNYEVDWQGIVHNANYLLYFETGRIEYLLKIGVKVDRDSIENDSKVVLVRNEVDYRSPARFNEALVVASRIVYIRDTSFAFGGVIFEKTGSRLIAENLAVHVWLDPLKNEPKRVPDDFRRRVRQFEGAAVAIQEPPGLA